MIKKPLLFLLGMLLLTSCASTLLTSKNVLSSEVQNIGYVEPISFISLIQKSNQTKPNDSLSLISTKVLDSIIRSSSQPKISKQLTFTDLKLKNRLENDLLKTMTEIRKSKKLDHIKTTPLMDSVAKSENQRFVLFTVNAGFARRKNNYGNQVLKGIGVGILTMGMYAPVPVKANTSTYAMIYDAQNSSVVFFNYFPLIEKSPVDRKNLNYIYSKLFETYYQQK